GAGRLHATPSPSGVSALSAADRAHHTSPTGGPSDPRQLWHPHPPGGGGLVCRAPPLSPALHPDRRFLAESGGTLLRRNHRQSDPARNLPQCRRVSTSDSRLHPATQPQSSTFRVDCLGPLHRTQGETL